MPTLGEARSIQDEQVERLRQLRRDKPRSPPVRQEVVQCEIDVTSQEISNLDTVIRRLMNEARLNH